MSEGVPSAQETILVDTSIAVPLVVSDHVAHAMVLTELGSLRLGLAGHALFETYSVLTRLPAPLRRSPADCRRLIEHNFPASRCLEPSSHAGMLERFTDAGITGGQVYDALVGSVAADAELPLATRDRRALETYRALGVAVRLLD